MSVGHVQALRRLVATQIASYHALLLGFSGGLDSTVLLDTLTVLRDSEVALHGSSALTLRAVYVHHGLSRYADRWAAHCAKECYRRGIVFSTVRVVLDAMPEGIEAAARNARYRALVATLAGDEVLLTAQHQDDQAETLLLALKRGSGPAGLAGMAADMLFQGRRLVRPLLECGRIELEMYARACGLHWIEDDSNTDMRFDRNFLRLQILPPLRQRWPQFVAAAARSAQLCAEQEQLLDELLAQTLNELTQPDGSLCLTTLTAMSDIRRAALLRRWLASHSVRMPSRRQLARLWQEVVLSRSDRVAQIQLDNRQVRRFRNNLYVLPRLSTLFDDIAILPWPSESELLTLPAGLGVLLRRTVDIYSTVQNHRSLTIPSKCDSDRVKGINRGAAVVVADVHISSNTHVVSDTNIVTDNKDITEAITATAIDGYNSIAVPKIAVRAPQKNELVSVRFGPVSGRLYIIGQRHGRTLKKIWRELNIPPWRRGSTPLLFYNDKLITAMGVFITWDGAIKESAPQWHLFWLPDSASAIAMASTKGGQS